MLLRIATGALGATENSGSKASQIALLIFMVALFVTVAVLILQEQRRSDKGEKEGGGGAT